MYHDDFARTAAEEDLEAGSVEDMDSVGIITPYRNQAEETNKALVPSRSQQALRLTGLYPKER
ncbi:hypothetical protein M109_1794 [Bacteroides fragilis str. 3397 N2]|nr:hypothetical protein M109_1794 [Bacteroides fragilis str. 3397 N2]